MTEMIDFVAPDSVLDSWRSWGIGLTGRPRVSHFVPGGSTNRSYRLEAPGIRGELLLRINHPDPDRLGIDRKQEQRILNLTADAGLSRPLLYWDPGHRFALFPYLEALSWSHLDINRAEQRRRVWPLLRRLRAISTRLPRRSYHAYLLHYWRQLEQKGLIEPGLRQAWNDFAPRLQAFDVAHWRARLTHHDLIPDNILDDGQRIWLIDWEYAAPGHPDIDIWTLDPKAVVDPFVPEMMYWINGLWERLRGIGVS